MTNGRVEIFNSLGALIKNSNLENNFSIDLSKQEKGIYYIKVYDGEELKGSGKFIKMD